MTTEEALNALGEHCRANAKVIAAHLEAAQRQHKLMGDFMRVAAIETGVPVREVKKVGIIRGSEGSPTDVLAKLKACKGAGEIVFNPDLLTLYVIWE